MRRLFVPIMKSAARLGDIGWIAVCLLLLVPIAGNARPTGRRGTARPVYLTIDVHEAHNIHLPEPAKTVFVASPDIADVQIATPSDFLIFGKKPGSTSVFAITTSGATRSYTVTVVRPVGEIAAAIRRAVPDANITVTGAPGGVTVSGHVASPAEAARVKAAAMQYVGDKETVNFNVSVDDATEVTLKVRVAEVSRNIDKELGVNWDALFNSGTIAIGLLTGRAPVTSFGHFIRNNSTSNFGSLGFGYHASNADVSALIDALDQDGLATILAEPTLTAVSGQTANFLAGGEFPIPVPQGNQTTTIQYKQFGISVDFTPTVLDGNRISIKVRPEVSQLTSVGQVVLDNVAVPALTVRRAETTVDLASGQSFAIAGLFQNNGTNQLRGLPWLADIPILGALFRSSSFQKNESELVIIVTPYIVRPTSKVAALHAPTDGWQFPSDVEQMLLGRLTAPPEPAQRAPVEPGAGPHLRGPAGFIME